MPTPLVEPPVATLVDSLRRAERAARSAGREAPFLGAPGAEWRRRTRAELGLPEQVAVVGSGHQSGFWHPGIVVKSMLAAELAATVGGAAFHVVVEQDIESPTALEVPVRDGHGSLGAVTLDLARATERSGATKAGDNAPIVTERMPSFDPPTRVPTPPGSRPAMPSVDAGLERIVAALRTRRGEPNAPLQVARAAFDLLADVVPPPHVIRSGALLDTVLGRALLGQMAAEPERCAAAYNVAVEGSPDAATPLAIHADRVEVPLWRLDEHGHRMRAWDDDLARAAAGGSAAIVLRPRALLLTAMMRLAACDLFIHGTGGAGYDVAMERWLTVWLGVCVAPAAVATTTLYLPFPEAQSPRVDLHAARRALREALFDPEQADAPPAARGRPGPRKHALLASVDAAPRRSLERRAAWRTLHDELAKLRAERAPAIAAHRRAVEIADQQSRERAIVESRLWAFPFFEPTVLADLRDAVRDAVAKAPMEPM